MSLVQPNGDEFLVNSFTNQDQSQPDVAALTGGGFVATWADNSDQGGDAVGSAVKAQIYTADGSTVGTEFLVNTETNISQSVCSVTGLSNGGFAITWTDASGASPDSSNNAVRARIFEADGTPLGDDFVVNTATQFSQFRSAITAFEHGGFIVTWADFSSTAEFGPVGELKSQVYLDDGTPVLGETLLADNVPFVPALPSIESLSNGTAVVAWTEVGADGDETAIRARILNGFGQPITAPVLVNSSTTGSQVEPDITVLSNGNFLISWDDAGAQADDSDGSVRGRLFAEDGTALGAEFRINDGVAGEQSEIAITALDSGGFLAVWSTAQGFGADTSDSAVIGQLFDASGTAIGSEFLVNTTTGDDQYDPEITTLENGDVVVIWTDSSTTGGDTSSLAVRAQILTVASTENVIVGTSVADDLTGSTGDDQLFGMAGMDSLYGGDGADAVFGGSGDDFIRGDGPASGSDAGDGADTLSGGTGNDSLGGNGGDDLLYGNAGEDGLWGSEGNDSLSGGDGDDRLYGGLGDDRLVGGDAADTLYGAEGGDALIGATGNDLLYGGAGSDALSGGDGDDFLRGDGPASGSTSSDGADTLSGGEGDDTLGGNGGDDLLRGGNGSDGLWGSEGSDTLDGGGDDDFLQGGNGADVFEVGRTGFGADTIGDFAAGTDILDLSALTLVAGDLDSSGDGIVTAADDLGTTNGSGDLVLSVGGGSITLVGVQSVDLSDVTL